MEVKEDMSAGLKIRGLEARRIRSRVDKHLGG